MTDEKEIKITFLPGCFDSFEGTQEELDSLIKEITESLQSSEFREANIMVVDEADMTPEAWDELAEHGIEHNPRSRILQ